MALLIILIVTVAVVAAMVHAIARDDRGHRPAPSSHATDPAFLPPASLWTR